MRNFLTKIPAPFTFLTVLATDGNNQLKETCFPLIKLQK